MSSFDLKKSIEDPIKDGLIITATITGIFFALKAVNDIPGCYEYHETCWWTMWRGIGERLYSLQKMDQRVIQKGCYGP